MENLRQVALNGAFADESIMQHLLTLRSLVSMFLETDEGETSAPDPPVPDTQILPHIRELTLSNGDHAPDSFLEAIRNRQTLRNLTIPWIYQYTTSGTGGDVYRILCSISDTPLHCLTIRLTSLMESLIVDRHEHYRLALLPIAQDYLRPLFRLSQLRVVKFELNVAFLVDNRFSLRTRH